MYWSNPSIRRIAKQGVIITIKGATQVTMNVIDGHRYLSDSYVLMKGIWCFASQHESLNIIIKQTDENNNNYKYNNNYLLLLNYGLLYL